jgi:hypothetical protein
VQEKSIEQLTAEIKSRYGIGGGGAGPKKFPIVLIRPSHYDEEGYVIQWMRPAAPSNPLAELQQLIRSSLNRKVLGAEVQSSLRSLDEEMVRVHPERLASQLQGGRGLVLLADVGANQFARAMDLTLPMRVAGVHVCMQGLFVSSNMALQGGVTPELREARNLGISLFAGTATQDRVDELVRDAWSGRLKLFYTTAERTATEGSTSPPIAAARRIQRKAGRAMRLYPFECSFCAVVDISEDAGEPRINEAEEKIRETLRHGAGRFLLADEHLSQNPHREELFDRLIAMREQEKLDIECILQVDATSHRLPGFIEKAARAGVRGIFLDLDPPGRPNSPGQVSQDAVTAWRTVLLEWKRAGVLVFARLVVGAPDGSADAVLERVRVLQRELPVDVLEPCCAPSQASEIWAKTCRDAWKAFYTPEHMEKVLRRGVATGTDVDNLMTVLLWFHFCVAYEKVDPLRGGSWRRKHRRDRQPSMEREDPLGFYPHVAVEHIYKQIKRLILYRRFRRFVKQLESQPGARSYTDGALTAANATGMLA